MSWTDKAGETSVGIGTDRGGKTYRLNCQSYDANQLGTEWISITDSNGKEIAYWDYQEWVDDPVLVMGAIMGAIITPEAADNLTLHADKVRMTSPEMKRQKLLDAINLVQEYLMESK